MVTKGIVNAQLDALLQTLAGGAGGDIHLVDGSIYYPQQGTPYLVGTLSAYERKTVGAGANGTAIISGTYTVSVMRPSIEGRVQADNVAGLVLQTFRRGTTLATGTSQTITIMNTSERPAVEHADWINVPVVASFMGTDP